MMFNLFALHRKQTDLTIQQIPAFFDSAPQCLIVPDHLFQRKRNLLPSLVLYDFSDFALFNRWQLNEFSQSVLAGQTDRHQIRTDRIPRQKRFQSLTDQLIRNGIGLIEQLGMGNVIKRHRHNLIRSFGIA